jgi:hypothetical protein
MMQGLGHLEKHCPFTHGTSYQLGKQTLSKTKQTYQWVLQCCLWFILGVTCRIFSVGCLTLLYKHEDESGIMGQKKTLQLRIAYEYNYGINLVLLVIRLQKYYAKN